MGARIRATDWSGTPLGPVAGWPMALRAVLLAVLHSPRAQAVLWGGDLFQLYNDATARLNGDKHPAAFGRSMRESWLEAWPVLQPIYEAVRRGESRQLFNQRLRLRRHADDHDAWFDLAFSPLFDDGGGIAGILVQIEETTDRMHAAARLAQASDVRLAGDDQRLSLALEAAELVGTWEWDLQRDRLLMDARFAGFCDLGEAASREGVTLEGFLAALHPDDRPRIEQRLRQCIADCSPYAEEHRLAGPAGRLRWVYCRARCEYDAEGRPRRLLGAAIDISEQKSSQQVLLEREQEIRKITDALPVLISIVDAEQRYHYLNAAYRTMLGHDPQALVGRSVRDVLGDELYQRLQPLIAGALAGERQSAEVRLHGRDGRERCLQTQYLPRLNSLGRVNGFYVLALDVTERERAERALRESEQHHRAVVELSPALHWAADAHGRIVWVAERSRTLTGRPAEQALGDGWQTLVHPEDLPGCLETSARAIATGEALDYEHRMRVADGSYHWMRVRARPLFDEQGRVLRWFGMSEDVQERRQAEQALRELNESLESRIRERTRALAEVYERLLAEMAKREHAQEALRQSQKMEAVGQLTGGIAHDFNNMLTGVIGSLDLLRRRLRSGMLSDAEHFVDIATQSAQRAAALTHRLLAFSRRQPLNPRRVDLDNLIRSMEELLRRTLGERIRIRIALGGVGPVYSDENQLESALLNLVINARDAMPDGGALTIETARVGVADCKELPTGEYAVLRVSDTGCGMSAQTLEKVFEPFFTTKPIGQGTGLGLSMIYGFAKQSGGHVRLTSEPGVGTVASLYLPLFPELTGRPVDFKPERGDPGPALAESGQSVLVVEDDMAVRLLVLDVLAELGYRTAEAGDAETALAVLESPLPIDLLISDVGLPGMNGRQLADVARGLRPELKVLFMTGYAETAAYHGFLAPGMELIAKPFSLDELSHKVRGMFGRATA